MYSTLESQFEMIPDPFTQTATPSKPQAVAMVRCVFVVLKHLLWLQYIVL